MTLNQFSFAFSAISMGLVTVLTVTSETKAATMGFNGTFDDSNFALDNNNADGSVDKSQADSGKIVLTGGNDRSGKPGTTDWTIANVGEASNVEFSWSFSGETGSFGSDDPVFQKDTEGDRAGYLKNGNFTELATKNGQSSTSPVQVSLAKGDSFGFRVETADNFNGPGELTVDNFQSESQSEPIPFGISTNTGILALIGGMASIAWRRRRRRSKTPQTKGSSSL